MSPVALSRGDPDEDVSGTFFIDFRYYNDIIRT
jgi:hypothetical protein